MRGEPPSAGIDLLNQQLEPRIVVKRVAGALAGLAVAFVVAHRTMHEIEGGGAIDTGRVARELLLFLALAAGALFLTSALPISNHLRKINQLLEQHEHDLRTQGHAQRFLRHVQSAFEMAEREEELYEVAGIALQEASDHPGEIIVADSSNAHLEQLVVTAGHQAPGCGVLTPHSCPAVRSGQSLRFDSPNTIASCPRLRERHIDDSHIAVCVPINVLGTPSAVLHTVRDSTGASNDELDDEVAALEGVAVHFGARLGLIRAMSQSQFQADTDPLTGLLNRRAMENRVREMRAEYPSYSVAMADLDRFKDLNDTFGHDTGDRALRLFARVLRSAVRDADIVARHGGEEFIIVLPGTDVARSAPVVHRVREHLVTALADAELPSFTVSIGLVDSSAGVEFSELVKLADRAMMQAKADGRDRMVIWDPSLTADPSDRSSDVSSSSSAGDHPMKPLGVTSGDI